VTLSCCHSSSDGHAALDGVTLQEVELELYFAEDSVVKRVKMLKPNKRNIFDYSNGKQPSGK
jgi:hypothetical protein